MSVSFGTLRWPEGETPRFGEAGFMFSETGVEATRRPIHWVTGGVCLLPTRGGHEVSSSFPLIKISRCPAFLVENASNGAASSPQMPRGCRIFAHFLRPHCVEGKFCQWLQRFLIPIQRPRQQMVLSQPRSSQCHTVQRKRD